MPLKKKTKKIKTKKPARKPAKKALKKKALKKKIIVKKRPVKKLKAKKTSRPKIKENILGIVTHYFPQVRAAVIKLKGPLNTGDTIKIKGHTTEFSQNIVSMQIDRVPIDSAKKGDEIGLLVNSRVRQHDKVFKV